MNTIMPNVHPDCFAGHGRSTYAYIWTSLSSVTFSVSSAAGPAPADTGSHSTAPGRWGTGCSQPAWPGQCEQAS